MVTKKGFIKRIELDAFSRPRKGGILGIKLKEDRLVDVKLTNGSNKLIIGTRKGMAIRFKETDVRTIGRSGKGVRGIRLVDDSVVGVEVSEKGGSLLTLTENGYGKRSYVKKYRLIRRGGKGVRNIKTSERNGEVVSIKFVRDNDEIMIISKKGKLIRVNVSGVSIVGRNSLGVRIIRLSDKDKAKALTKIVSESNGLES